jgi:hypothetical protein
MWQKQKQKGENSPDRFIVFVPARDLMCDMVRMFNTVRGAGSGVFAIVNGAFFLKMKQVEHEQQQAEDWSTNEKDGREYFYNEATKASTWEKPQCLSAESMVALSGDEELYMYADLGDSETPYDSRTGHPRDWGLATLGQPCDWGLSDSLIYGLATLGLYPLLSCFLMDFVLGRGAWHKNVIMKNSQSQQVRSNMDLWRTDAFEMAHVRVMIDCGDHYSAGTCSMLQRILSDAYECFAFFLSYATAFMILLEIPLAMNARCVPSLGWLWSGLSVMTYT